MIGTDIIDLVPHVGELIGNELQRGRDIDQRHGFQPAVVAQEGEHRFQHRSHLVEIGEHAGAMDVVLDEFGAQPHPRDRRAQIMADRGEHPGAVVDQSADALPHAVERLRDEADFFGPALGKRRGGAVQAETFGGLRERGQRRGQGAGGPQAEQGDADHRKQQRHHPRAAPEWRSMPVRGDACGNRRAVRQCDADPARVAIRRRARRSGSPGRGADPGRAGRGRSGQRLAVRLRLLPNRAKVLDIELRKCARDIGGKTRSLR